MSEDSYQARLEALDHAVVMNIATYGVHIQGVVGEQGTSFCYTVGLTGVGHPELVVATPAGAAVGATILNRLAAKVRGGESVEVGTGIDDVLEHFPVAIIDIDVRSEDYPLSVAGRMYGYERVRGRQIVLPDRWGRFPWQEGYSMPQALLGAGPPCSGDETCEVPEHGTVTNVAGTFHGEPPEVMAQALQAARRAQRPESSGADPTP